MFSTNCRRQMEERFPRAASLPHLPSLIFINTSFGPWVPRVPSNFWDNRSALSREAALFSARSCGGALLVLCTCDLNLPCR